MKSEEILLTEKEIQLAWESGQRVPNFDPQLYRKDEFGAWMKRTEFEGDFSSLSLGWGVRLLSGDSGAGALRPMQWENLVQASRGDEVPKVKARGIQNVYACE